MVAKPMPASKEENKMLAAAGGFTGLWAVTWLGTSAMAAGAVVQGGFAVGTVMAGSGLTALWWKTRAVSRYHEASGDDAEASAARETQTQKA